MVFITGDALGSIFSLISLAFRDHFDLLAALNYVIVLVCDLIVVGFFVWFNKMHPEQKRELDNDRVEDELDPETLAKNSVIESSLKSQGTPRTSTNKQGDVGPSKEGGSALGRASDRIASDGERQQDRDPSTVIVTPRYLPSTFTPTICEKDHKCDPVSI